MARLVGELDPITFEVVLHRLLDITEEMGIKYMRTSGSPILVGAYDASTGIPSQTASSSRSVLT
jgi:N-methylhydantoinase B